MPTTRTALPAAVGLIGLLVTFHPTLLSGFARMQPEAGDVVLNHYFLEHTYRWAFDRHYPFSFWSPGFFYPTPHTFTYSETLIGTAPLYWLLRAGFPETVSCQLWVMVVYLLNYAAMAVVLRWFGVHPALAAGGAFVFAFGLVRTDHLTHQQLMPQFFSPFAVWYAWGFLTEPTVRRWWLLWFLGAWQVLASLHLGWFLGFGLCIFAGWGLAVEAGSWRRVRTFFRERPIAALVPVLLAGLVVGAYARNFYRGNPERRGYSEAVAYLPPPDAWVVGAPGSLWADHLTARSADSFPEQSLFQGVAVYAVMGLAGWYALRRRFAGHGLVLAGVGSALTLAFLVTQWGRGVSPWFLVHQLVPGANAFRAVGRAAFVAYLLGLVGGLVGVQAFLTDRVARPRWRIAIFLGIAGLMAIEQVRWDPESFDKEEACYGPARAVAEQLRGADAGYVVFDGSMPSYRHHIVAMWGGLWADVPVMNGFSGTQPANFPAYEDQPTLPELLRALGPGWRGQLVVIEWGPPVRRRVYQVEPGELPAARAVLVER